MSKILDRGLDTIVVFPEITTTDSRGNVVKKPSDIGVTVKGVTMEHIAAERTTDGRIHNDYRLFARDAPLAAFCMVEWQGKQLTPTGPPRPHTASAGTKHLTIILREVR